MEQSDTLREIDPEFGIDATGPENAQPIVFVHGAIFTRKMWAPQRNALSDEFRVLAPDLPGHGARADQQIDLDQAVRLIEEVIDTHTDGSAIVVGLSLGGYVATELAYRSSDSVDGLVLAGCSANPVGGMKQLTRAVGGVSRLATRNDRVENAVRWAAKRWVNKRDLPQPVKDEIIDGGFYPRQFGEAGPELAGHDFRKSLARYPGPSLIVNGERDKIMRRGEEDHAKAAHNGRVVVIDGVGHVCNLHSPMEFTHAVRDLERQSVAYEA